VNAASEIVQGIKYFSAKKFVDLVIISRGGVHLKTFGLSMKKQLPEPFLNAKFR